MNVTRCKNGHLYDADKDIHCPFCDKGDKMTMLVENVSDFCKGAIVLKTELTDVSVFKTYAQMRRCGKIKMTGTRQRVVILGLPVKMMTSSLHIITGRGLFNKGIGLFQYKEQENSGDDEELTNAQAFAAGKEEYEKVKQSIQIKEQSIKSLEKYQEKLSEDSLDLDDFCEVLLSVEKKLKEEWEKKREYEKQAVTLKKQIRKINPEKLFWGAELDLLADDVGEYGVIVDYVAEQTGWTPSYDIMTYKDTSEMTLILRADISQNTGEDWKNVRLHLSNAPAMPNQNASRLSPMKLSIFKGGSSFNLPAMFAGSVSHEDREDTVYPEVNAYYDAFDMEDAPETYHDTSNAVEESTDIQRHFLYQGSFSLADGHKKMVTLISEDIQIEKLFFSIPKRECCEYVGMYAETLMKRSLLSCKANIYIDNVFSTSFFTDGIGENGIIILGRREGLLISRKEIKDKDIKKMFSGQAGVERKYEIVIENETGDERELLVMDQIPIADDERIIIKDIRASGADVDENGICRWNVKISAKSRVVLTLEYKIFSPKDVRILGFR